MTSDQSKPASTWKKPAAIILLLLVSVTAAFIWAILPPREPSYKDKPLSYWLELFETKAVYGETSAPVYVECQEAVQHIGTNAIPHLLRMIREKDSPLKRELLLRAYPLEKFFRNQLFSASRHQALAQGGFLLLGDLGTNAIPALLDICTHPPSEASKDVASVALMQLYPAHGDETPHWLPAKEQPEWYDAVAMFNLRTGKMPNALLALSAAIKLQPTNAALYATRGDVNLELDDFPAAIADAEHALSLEPSNYDAVFLRAACNANTKQFKTAEADFTSCIELNTNDSRAFNYRGLARAHLRQFDSAIADLTKAIILSPDEPTAYRNRAMVEAIQKDFEIAITDASTSIQLNPRDPLSYSIRGRIRAALKDYDAAVADLDYAIALNPKDFESYGARAAAWIYKDQFDRAESDIEKAFRINPKATIVFAARGLLKVKRDTDGPGALANFQQIVDLTPERPESYTMLGLFQYRFADRQVALKTLSKALQLGSVSNDPELHAYIWLIRAQAGEQDNANAELETYLKTTAPTKSNKWAIVIARYFTDHLPESDFLAQAPLAVRRSSEVKGQISDSYYYAGMKHKLAGDTKGAAELFQKCIDVKNDNTYGYLNATAELHAASRN